MKKKYLIKLNTEEVSGIDPNLERALQDIQSKKSIHGDAFDFELSFLFDGFMINESFDAILNTFLHDVIQEDSLFHSIYESERFSEYVKRFLLNVLQQPLRITGETFETSCVMDAFIWTKKDGKPMQFYTSFVLPKTVINDERYEDFLMQGPDYLTAHLTPIQIFDYLLAPLYYELGEIGELDNDALKDFGSYQMGLH